MRKSLFHTSTGTSLILQRVAAAVRESKKCIQRLNSPTPLSATDRNYLKYGYQECAEVIGLMTPAVTTYYSDRLAREIDTITESEDIRFIRDTQAVIEQAMINPTPIHTDNSDEDEEDESTTSSMTSPPPTTTTTTASPLTAHSDAQTETHATAPSDAHTHPTATDTHATAPSDTTTETHSHPTTTETHTSAPSDAPTTTPSDTHTETTTTHS